MATPRKGAIIKPFDSAEIARVTRTPTGAQGVETAPSAAMTAAFEPAVQFFPSGRPLRPVAPEGTTTGRAWDFPSFLNMAYLPRSESGETAIDFPTLRAMASPEHGGLDLLRLVIETRKDQMSAQRWSIRAKGDRNDTGGAKGEKLREWLRKPDGIHTFRGWMRLILEDHFVLDQVAIYMGKSATRPLWEIMSGDTIKPYITADGGRTPLPPLPAYSQVIKGMPAEDYTLDELGVYVYNPLPNRLYGLSRVAQVITTVNSALNRALSQLEYFTSGTVPDAFMELPKEWNLQRIQQWQEWFNSELEGQVGERRKVRFVPEGAKYTPTKTEVLKDVFDEWMARIVCYCFSLPPQAFVKEMNRATAETAKEAAQEEGLEPTKIWFKDVVDDLFTRVDADDLELYWEDEEIVDPAAKATVVVQYHGGTTGTAQKIITLDEAREMAGFAPATDEQRLELQPPAPEPVDDPEAGDGEPGATNGAEPKTKKKEPKATKAAAVSRGRSLPPPILDERRILTTQRALHATVGAVLTAQRSAVRAALGVRAAKAAGDDDVVTEERLRDLIRAVEEQPWNTARQDELRAALEDLAQHANEEAVRHVMQAVGADNAATVASLTQGNALASAWATARVGNLITQVSQTTQDLVNELTANAIDSGLTNAELAARLDGAFLFGDDRALMIARTETQFAANHGSLGGYKASGVVEGKEWFGEDPCEDCELNMEDGVIGLDEEFSSGDDCPPAHPNCKCSVAPTVTLAGEKRAGFRRQALARMQAGVVVRT
jgi:hypothetical protein